MQISYLFHFAFWGKPDRFMINKEYLSTTCNTHIWIFCICFLAFIFPLNMVGIQTVSWSLLILCFSYNLHIITSMDFFVSLFHVKHRMGRLKPGSYFSRMRQPQPQINKFLLFFEPHAAAAAACRCRMPLPHAAAACRCRMPLPHSILNTFEKVCIKLVDWKILLLLMNCKWIHWWIHCTYNRKQLAEAKKLKKF